MSNPRELLTWESTYAIAIRLIEEYPDVDPVFVGTQQLLDMILALPDFADEAILAHEALLADILRVWYEETLNL
jgi:FeS assembly protein IscX